MTRLQQVAVDELENPSEQAIARLALLARADCIHGGASAMTVARRLMDNEADEDDEKFRQTNVPYVEIISAAYTSFTGTAGEFLPYECPECGQARLGITAATECCAENENWEGDDLCDQCMRSGVQVARTNSKDETICVDCDDDYDEDHPEEFDDYEQEEGTDE